jgi:hypothetical protein
MGGIQKTTQPCYKAEKKISQNIFLEICIGGHQANNLWPAVKPFLAKKLTGGQEKIALMENDKKDVCDTINFYFCKCCK